MARATSNTTRNWGDFLRTVKGNQYLTDESTDTSLQPGEEYPTTEHPNMVNAYKQKHATLNQIAILIETSPASINVENRASFSAHKSEAENNWLYPYTVENPCGTQLYEHWLAKFITAVVQIVSTEFQL